MEVHLISTVPSMFLLRSCIYQEWILPDNNFKTKTMSCAPEQRLVLSGITAVALKRARHSPFCWANPIKLRQHRTLNNSTFFINVIWFPGLTNLDQTESGKVMKNSHLTDPGD